MREIGWVGGFGACRFFGFSISSFSLSPLDKTSLLSVSIISVLVCPSRLTCDVSEFDVVKGLLEIDRLESDSLLAS